MLPTGPIDYIDVPAVMAGVDDGVSLSSRWLDLHAELGVLDHEIGEAHGELWQAVAAATPGEGAEELEAAELAVHGPPESGLVAVRDAEEGADDAEIDVSQIYDGAPGELFQPAPNPFVAPADPGFGPPSDGDTGDGSYIYE